MTDAQYDVGVNVREEGVKPLQDDPSHGINTNNIADKDAPKASFQSSTEYDEFAEIATISNRVPKPMRKSDTPDSLNITPSGDSLSGVIFQAYPVALECYETVVEETSLVSKKIWNRYEES